LTLSFFGFFDSRLPFCSPLAMPLSLNLKSCYTTVHVWLDRILSATRAKCRFWPAHRVKQQSGRELPNRATIYHSHLDAIAVDAFELMLLSERIYRRNIAEQHQRLALRAHSSSNSRGPD
jgi:hypothetical protein